ncbi:MAG TPA: MBL fold metallo-hydrolase [Candidatus Contendobacter sp.]|nr:MBL fold metallo-hydrolase [Candidatus Contendobacter sp.]HRZ24452.1 MBL fold metallo-hydrolase [Candidatus Contendobacter sp.]
MAQPITITREIFQVGGQGLTAPEDAAIYLIQFDDHAALVDAGAGHGQKRLLGYLATVGVRPEQIEYLLLTHCHYDHTGGAHDLRDKLGCPVVMHELDADFLERGDNEVTAASWYGSKLQPCPVDRRLRGAQETLPLGGHAITALHIPGHSPGSVAYLVESEGQTVLFGQDVHGPLDLRLHSNRADYRASLERLLALEADILCEGHYGIFRGKPAVAEFIRSFLDEAY